ncbi:MAG TPA: hypothetical protein VFF98_05425, partial [Novosphingobium sp.]|nr:hypothetical protein [Novosphingobium sp.]
MAVSTFLWPLLQDGQLIERELLLFALFWFAIGLFDELLIDFIWLILQVNSKKPARAASPAGLSGRLAGPMAVLIPAWQEAAVIGATISHMLRAWPQGDYRLFIGCYGNDP